jgi:hypothetical protein
MRPEAHGGVPLICIVGAITLRRIGSTSTPSRCSTQGPSCAAKAALPDDPIGIVGIALFTKIPKHLLTTPKRSSTPESILIRRYTSDVSTYRVNIACSQPADVISTSVCFMTFADWPEENIDSVWLITGRLNWPATSYEFFGSLFRSLRCSFNCYFGPEYIRSLASLH